MEKCDTKEDGKTLESFGSPEVRKGVGFWQELLLPQEWSFQVGGLALNSLKSA